ncbi:hypothetical protein [Halorientalis regularis]|uniref:Uncharacterized protein n=1 Tax=Halorientalis regularis TaxID=660518 RepID=A0A1G7HH68_9EURY|nr:hypothetical protein [Halorientalis regularis]SDE99701.1 hypothetical protein SAMN05216218_10320 [Halorientalis regularis]
MSAPSVPPNSGDIMKAVQQALHGLDIGSTEAVRILSWANSETPAIYDRDQTAYLVLGSYRDPYLRRVRAVSDRLNRRYGTYAFLIGDLSDIDLPRLPEFRVKFHITATLSDYVAAVFEQDAGGEINELGKLGETEYFEKAYALPRAYHWDTESHLSDERDVIAAGAQTMAATDIDDESKSEELDALVDRATQAGIDISVDEVTTALADDDFEVPSYSWVHLNDFRLFELHERCYPWTTEDELLAAADDLPGSPRPDWEQN